MIFRFNTAQLGTKMESCLNTLLAEMQKTQKEEIEVIADEFPYKLIVKAANGSEAKIAWDADAGDYKFVGEPLPASQPESPNVGEIKDWQRPEKAASSPEPISVSPLEFAVGAFIALSPEQRTAFFNEVWRSVSEEKK